MVQTQVSPEIQECISTCEECHRICLETAAFCLAEGGRHGESQHVGLLIDCAEICQTSANFMLRNSVHHAHTCRACAEICERCMRSCEEFENDEEMERCAEICRRCAESCRRMSRMHASDE